MRPPTVTLLVKEMSDSGKDALGNPVTTLSEPEELAGCLWAPGTPAGIEVDRPDGASVSATAFVPRGWAARLRGGKVSADGGATWLDVVGEPVDWPSGELPPGWPFGSMLALGRHDG